MSNSTFVIDSSMLLPDSSVRASIFDDVESSKKRLLELRKQARARQAQSGAGASQSTLRPVSEDTDVVVRMRSMNEAETGLVEAAAVRSALETRKAEIQKTILILMEEITATLKSAKSVDTPDLDDSEPSADTSAAPRKKPRYFDSSKAPKDVAASPPGEVPSSIPTPPDDLSSVVCPYELMGKCTDPSCPHMHLNR
jgi:hypothetical protein